MRSSFDNLNTYSTQDSSERLHPLKMQNPITKSINLETLGAVNKKHKINVALRKQNQKLLKNVDFPLLKNIMKKDCKGNTKAGPVIQVSDYNIKEMHRPNKQQLMAIPQKRVRVYDCINNVNRVFQPPSLELESETSYRDNYYNTIRNNSKSFHKNMGYFSYYNEKTRREREMNKLYDRKNLTQLASKIRDNSYSDKKDLSPKLKQSMAKPISDKSRYCDGQKWMQSKNNKSVRASVERKQKEFKEVDNLRYSNAN
jgi:hypothetical protein